MPIDKQAQDDLQAALLSLRDRRPAYQRYGEYYDGVHRLAFATHKFLNAFGTLFAAFAANHCPAVVDALVDRLVLERFTSEGAAPGQQQRDVPDTDADIAWDIWLRNRMDRRAGEVHVEAARSGDAYVIVWPDADGLPVLYPNRGDRPRGGD